MHDLADENCSEPTATFRFRPESWQKQNTAASWRRHRRCRDLGRCTWEVCCNWQCRMQPICSVLCASKCL